MTEDQFDWNVVATVYEDGFREARALLRPLGELRATNYHNVLVMRVDDVADFLAQLRARIEAEPRWLNFVSRVVPATVTFDFEDPATFEERSREAATTFVPLLAGKRFHVRVHRRGFGHRISGQGAEQLIDRMLLDALNASGTPGSIDFDDPDAVVLIETVGGRAGISLWTREDLARYPFLHVD